MAQHGVEALAVDRLVGVLAVGLQQRHPPLGLGGQPLAAAPWPCRASPATDRAASRRNRPGPAGTTDGPRRRRRRARAPGAAAGAQAAAGASRRCARSPFTEAYASSANWSARLAQMSSPTPPTYPGTEVNEVGLVFVTSVTVRVPAKINLQLAVGPLRPDGYHGLVTVFHAVSLFDEVTVAPAGTDSVTVSGEGAGPCRRTRTTWPSARSARCRGAGSARRGLAAGLGVRRRGRRDDRQADPGRRRHGRRQRRRRRRARRLQRALGRRPYASRSCARSAAPGRQRRGVRRARRHRGRPGPWRAARPRAGVPRRVPLGPGARRRPPVHPGRLPASSTSSAPARTSPSRS